MAEKAKIIVAAHKTCAVPTDSLYLPLFVGAAVAEANGAAIPGAPFQRDDTGDNISGKNRCFGSQTGLYWAWKNLDAEYLGLVHYRRFFLEGKHTAEDPFSGILTAETLEKKLKTHTVFVPRKRRYYIETLYSHYAHTMDPTHMDTVREIIEERSPAYLGAFDRVMNRRWGYMFNMMILRRDLMDSYCTWLFDTLFETERRIGHEGMSEFENRYCGRISERLLNVWLLRMIETGQVRKRDICELPYMEQVNYLQKVKDFLGARFFQKRYTRSN